MCKLVYSNLKQWTNCDIKKTFGCQDQESDNESATSEEDDIALATLYPRAVSERPQFRWRKKDYIFQDSTFTGPVDQYNNLELQTPLKYFQRYITDEIVDDIVQNTNLYSVQKTGKSVDTSRKELEMVIGMYFRMGLVKMSSVRQYWESESNYEPVSGVMSRNRFQLLLRSLHFVDNLNVSDDDKKDKLWKLRPFLSSIRENCLLQTPEEYNAIDEMMCQFRGKTSPIRQYIKGKPHPWGFKIWARAANGVLYDFEVYQGGNGQRSELGQGPDVVLKLTSTLKKNCNYKIYADNLFTTVALLVKLKEEGMTYTGTVRKNRLKGCSLEDETSLKKRGRGAYDYRIEEQHNISAVRWYDNRAVTLLSTKTGLEPVMLANRWDKAARVHVEVPMPAVVDDYNKHMGGVDELDQYLGAYRFKMRSRRWYLYLFWQFIMVGMVNAWNAYRKEYAELALPPKGLMNRRRFQVSRLMLCNVNVATILSSCSGTS